MLVREVPFDSQALILGACSIIMIFCSVCFAVAMIWDDKKWIEALMEKVCIRFILPLGLVFIAGVMATGTALSSSPRPVFWSRFLTRVRMFVARHACARAILVPVGKKTLRKRKHHAYYRG